METVCLSRKDTKWETESNSDLATVRCKSLSEGPIILFCRWRNIKIDSAQNSTQLLRTGQLDYSCPVIYSTVFSRMDILAIWAALRSFVKNWVVSKQLVGQESCACWAPVPPWSMFVKVRQAMACWKRILYVNVGVICPQPSLWVCTSRPQGSCSS